MVHVLSSFPMPKIVEIFWSAVECGSAAWRRYHGMNGNIEMLDVTIPYDVGRSFHQTEITILTPESDGGPRRPPHQFRYSIYIKYVAIVEK